jgi:putative transposase
VFRAASELLPVSGARGRLWGILEAVSEGPNCRALANAQLTAFVFEAAVMVRRWVSFLFVMLAEHFSARRSAQIQFMQLQIELLRQKLGGNRVILSPEDRARMLKAGAEFDHDVHDVLGIVAVKTYRQWQREEVAGRQVGRVGHVAMSKSIRELILRLAKENVGWGVRRVLGELKKLAIKTSRSSVRRLLVDEGILPDPNRHAPKGVVTPWRTFVAGHMHSLVACDFFCKAIWTPFGKKMAYVLAFVHLGTRKVFVTSATEHPTEAWMLQQSRNVHAWADDERIDLRFLIHDRDIKFSNAFDETFDRKDGGVVLTPFLAPIANCFAESWIGSLKRECLNHFFCFSMPQLDYIVRTYVAYYNSVRPHQGLGNVPIAAIGKPAPVLRDTEPIGTIRCQELLGGLLRHYYRKAA